MTIYKYLHPDRTDVLRGQSIRFSSPASLNDPFELKPYVSDLASPELIDSELDRLLPELIQEELNKLPSNIREQISPEALKLLIASQIPQMRLGVHSMAQMLTPNLQERIHGGLSEKLGILCLSRTADSLLMWAHYADSHRGFAIGFDEKSSFFDQRVSPNDELRHLRKVSYSDKRPSLRLSEIDDFTAFMTKGLDWEYEAEWRMVMPLDSANTTLGDGPQAIHLFRFPADAVSSIILGCNMAESKKVEIREILAKSSHYRHVGCIEAKIDNEHYRVHVSDPAYR